MRVESRMGWPGRCGHDGQARPHRKGGRCGDGEFLFGVCRGNDACQGKYEMSPRQTSGMFSNPACFLLLVSFLLSCAFSPSAAAQSCGSQGVAVQVLGSGGPELQDKRASSSYLVWENGQARVLVDAGGGSALRFGERAGPKCLNWMCFCSLTSMSITAGTSPH